MNEWIFLKVNDSGERERVCGILAKNGYEVRFGKRRLEGKTTYIYGVEYRETA
ncbi:MAG: hypothetical protein IJS71_08515 [Clostridia bacterium]|nr:hypothetical protein [Clostridia bacterium]